MPFGDIELARRIERLEAGLIARASQAAHRRNDDGGGFAIPVAGGVASYTEPGSPFNKVAGIGFEGRPAATELEEIEARYREAGAPVRVELSSLAEPSVIEALGGRGYVLVGFENVLGASVADASVADLDGSVEVRRSPGSEMEAWLELVVDAFEAPDEQGVPSDEEFPRETILRAMRDFDSAGLERYSALVEGELAGGGSFKAEAGVAYLAGAATAPAFRGRGVHSALLDVRLRAAVESDCDVAVIVTQPGSTSQKNVWRRGFELLYTRAVLVRDPVAPGEV
jgi:GNAT superfamily N-acetyltransferase